jgi:hypothetical protein
MLLYCPETLVKYRMNDRVQLLMLIGVPKILRAVHGRINVFVASGGKRSTWFLAQLS